jgi:hypothetical protein
LQLLHQRFKIGLIVKVIGVNGGMTDEISSSSDIAALWRGGLKRRIMRCEVRCDAGRVFKGVKMV